MSIFRKFRQWDFPKQRLEAFSDAVFAIVMTLLVLELKLPHIQDAGNTHAIWAALRSVSSLFFSWAVSFFFVAIIWMHHHHILHMARQSDMGVIWINTFLLFFVCLLPFPTALMGEYPHAPLLLSFWGLTVAATCLMLEWLYHYCTKHYLKETYNAARVRRHVRLSLFAGPLLYLAAALLAWVSVYIAYALYVAAPVLYALPLDKEEAGNAVR